MVKHIAKYRYVGNGNGRVGSRPAHIVMAEKALGRRFKGSEQIHHVDGNGTNNAPGNLVLCPNFEYHMLLHRRTDALLGCGHPDLRRCQICKQWDDPKNLSILDCVDRHGMYRDYPMHVECRKKQRNIYYDKNKEVIQAKRRLKRKLTREGKL